MFQNQVIKNPLQKLSKSKFLYTSWLFDYIWKYHSHPSNAWRTSLLIVFLGTDTQLTFLAVREKSDLNALFPPACSMSALTVFPVGHWGQLSFIVSRALGKMKTRESTLAFLFVIFGLIHSRNYKVMKCIEAEKKASALTFFMPTVHPMPKSMVYHSK